MCVSGVLTIWDRNANESRFFRFAKILEDKKHFNVSYSTSTHINDLVSSESKLTPFTKNANFILLA